MPTYVTREEFEPRIAVVEREVEGEKLVSRYILKQTRLNGDDLGAVKSRLDRVEQKLDDLGQQFNGLSQQFNGLSQQFNNLVRSLPGIVADTMREVNREREGK